MKIKRSSWFMLQILLKNIRKIIAEDINTVNRIVYTNQSRLATFIYFATNDGRKIMKHACVIFYLFNVS